jgi:hypothetical protein
MGLERPNTAEIAVCDGRAGRLMARPGKSMTARGTLSVAVLCTWHIQDDAANLARTLL